MREEDLGAIYDYLRTVEPVRNEVIRFAREEGVPVDERALQPEDLEAADEVFLTSTAREILPVTAVGERQVGAGRPGPLTYRLHHAFRRLAGGPVGLSAGR